MALAKNQNFQTHPPGADKTDKTLSLASLEQFCQFCQFLGVGVKNLRGRPKVSWQGGCTPSAWYSTAVIGGIHVDH
jgi:hypothetical protein